MSYGPPQTTGPLTPSFWRDGHATFPVVKAGWICAKCGRSYGPTAVECFHCNAKITLAEMGTPRAP